MDHRLWMYNMHYETGACLKPEFIDGVRNFIEHTMTLEISRLTDWLSYSSFVPNGFKPDILYGLIMEKVMD
ncbi:hypothetical protein H5410_055974 [Solanum commersonii]|uniref:Uncharacterized protein n=1 Tax=Solanum commersonii TaxID=4109 RepID=A0A9J5WLD1_SOLCO|nr:hypothetical protein H5410_055974 [Solanum commersonii]